MIRKRNSAQKKSDITIMGILNVTPDSFSDGGKFFDASESLHVKRAVAQAARMIREGADIIDIGGESSGPDSKFVPLAQELSRTIPVIAAIHKKFPRVIISIDTYKSEVAREAISAGATMVNDVTALRGDSKMVEVIANAKVPIILMYSKDKTARTTREKKQYADVIKTIFSFLKKRTDFAVKKGVARSKIIIDPGMGAFISGDPKYSYEVLARLAEFKKLRCPILIGASRKGFLPGTVSERLAPTLLAHKLAVKNGANIIRVHDVAEHATILRG